MLLKFLVCLILFIAFEGHASALDPARYLSQYAHDSWGSEQGLPQNCAHALAQTSDGYIWFGTEEGLVRFDGVRMTVFDRSNTDAIKNNSVQALAAGDDGSLWIGTNNELIKFQSGRFVNITARAGINTRFSSIHVSADNRVWAGTLDGIFLFSDGNITRFLQNESVVSIVGDKDGDLWVVLRDRRVYKLKQDHFEQVGIKQGFPSDQVLNIFAAKEGGIWLALAGHSLFRWNHGQGLTVTRKNGLPGDVSSMIEDRDHNLWVTTEAGVTRCHDGSCITFAGDEALSSYTVTGMLEDAEGSLWFGTH